jgi:SAM-dependent methyltransferase
MAQEPVSQVRNPLPDLRRKALNYGSMEIPTANQSHLGGYTKNSDIGDRATFYPNMWAWAVKLFGITSVIDIGCGEGVSTAFFQQLGCDVLGVEGYGPAVTNSRVPAKIVQHDYTTGPFVPSRKFDMAWSCEFVEHVEERYIENYLATFQQASMVFLTFALPGQGGHHHVNEQPQTYWVEQFGRLGFLLDDDATKCARAIAQADHLLVSPDYPSHFITKGLVFFRTSTPFWNAAAT